MDRLCFTVDSHNQLLSVELCDSLAFGAELPRDPTATVRALTQEPRLLASAEALAILHGSSITINTVPKQIRLTSILLWTLTTPSQNRPPFTDAFPHQRRFSQHTTLPHQGSFVPAEQRQKQTYNRNTNVTHSPCPQHLDLADQISKKS